MKTPPHFGLTALVAGGLALSAAAQQPDAQKQDVQKYMADRLDYKLAQPWIRNFDWTTDYDRARAKAKKAGVPIFAYFTRSFAY